MKTLIIVILAVCCTWFVAQWLPTPADLLDSGADRIPSGPEAPNLPKPTPEINDHVNIEELELQTYELINRERLEAGLGVLDWNEYWHEKAREHSEYMEETGDFKHSTLNTHENIFCAEFYEVVDAPAWAIVNWMDSPGHKANLLEKSISSCGIGIAGRGDTYYVTFMAD